MPSPGAGVLVLGSSGFIGRHAAESLRQAGHDVITSSSTGEGVDLACDLLDPASVEATIKSAGADAILMAAGMSSVRLAWQDPEACFRLNTRGVFNLLDALKKHSARTHLVFTSSASVYGPPPSPDSPPFTEGASPAPASPYAASKLAAEILCRQYARQYGIDVLVLRLFNQIGPGQGVGQAPSDFARQIAVAEKAGEQRLELEVGNPEAKRDYTDVRDSARLITAMIRQRSTGTFNLCSGEVIDLAGIVEGLQQSACIHVQVRPEVSRAHPVDVNEVSGSTEKLFSKTKWRPEIPLRQSISDLLDDWRSRA